MSKELLDSIKDALVASSPSEREGANYLEDALRALDANIDKQAIAPRTLDTVDEYFEAAVSLGDGGHAQRVGNALYALRKELQWERAYDNYASDPFMTRFRANFAATVLMWPGARERGLFRNESVGVAITLQAPHTLYPTHAHKAVEFYYPLGGTAEWLRGEEGWTSRPPGLLFFHDTGVRHATRTGEEPLLSLIVWVNDFDSEGVIVRA